MYQVSINENSMFSKVQQIVNSLSGDIEAGRLKNEYKLPSINSFSEKNGVARDTVEKAYKQLRRLGYITSSPGRGYFVVGKSKKKLKMLLIADKLNPIDVTNRESLLGKLFGNDKGELPIDFCFPESFKELTEKSLKNYDYCIIRPDLFFKVNDI